MSDSMPSELFSGLTDAVILWFFSFSLGVRARRDQTPPNTRDSNEFRHTARPAAATPESEGRARTWRAGRGFTHVTPVSLGLPGCRRSRSRFAPSETAAVACLPPSREAAQGAAASAPELPPVAAVPSPRGAGGCPGPGPGPCWHRRGDSGGLAVPAAPGHGRRWMCSWGGMRMPGHPGPARMGLPSLWVWSWRCFSASTPSAAEKCLKAVLASFLGKVDVSCFVIQPFWQSPVPSIDSFSFEPGCSILCHASYISTCFISRIMQTGLRGWHFLYKSWVLHSECFWGNTPVVYSNEFWESPFKLIPKVKLHQECLWPFMADGRVTHRFFAVDSNAI